MAFGGEAEALFSEFYAEAPEPQRSIYTTAMGIVDEAWVAADGGVLDLAVDGGAFDGALRAFTTPGPTKDELAALPPDAAAIMEALSETAATYGRVASPDLGWGTAYKTLNRRAGAFFGGFALWPKETVDARPAAPPFFRFAFFRATRGRRVAGAQPHALLWLRVARESERPLHAPGVRAAEGRARPRLSFCFFSSTAERAVVPRWPSTRTTRSGTTGPSRRRASP